MAMDSNQTCERTFDFSFFSFTAIKFHRPISRENIYLREKSIAHWPDCSIQPRFTGLKMSQTSTTKKFGRPSRLKYEDKICDQCGIKLAVKIAGSRSPNFQKLYYICDRDGFIGWANPINEDELAADCVCQLFSM
ncbi:aspartate carbamoyltransferase regulatory chain [Striga asiatica]|uniref:Aspartate carbamoyltransferase regulatory chain n=1 Tax=Striga asiatica TaxID=4170 RepID=A0A5A7QBI8_STRAF|nr:aspartate carbamoyltransferase regulatory chain [Striga asiatica]